MVDSILIPFNDLSEKLSQRHSGILDAVDRVLKSGWLVLGPEVKQFESEFADYVGTGDCIGVANGTDAIEIALRAGGITPSNKVATVANAGMYALTAIHAIGGEPIFIDVDGEHLSATLTGVNGALAKGAHAVVVTHLYGAICPDIVEIADRCRSANVLLVEDCAQAHGASLGRKKAGAFGDIASFSFYPTKNLGSIGDGGAVVTGNPKFADRAKLLRQYGWSKRFNVDLIGGRNSRLDEIQAAVLLFLLPHLDRDNALRAIIAKRYCQEINNSNIILPPWRDTESAHHLYVVRTPERNSLQNHLSAKGIGHAVHYPVPDHRQPVFSKRFAEIVLPVTEESTAEILSLPCYSEMRDDHVTAVIEAVNEWQI